ncbi:MAG: ABC transporter ATP-binding protein [Pseudomonadales bacterium]|nr:ABC transporter ATP-binding protein [Pseudomonadales bacterium]
MLLTLQGVSKYFAPPEKVRPALQGIDVHLEAGEIMAVLGPDGAGKTTLMRLCAGLMKPSVGTLQRDDRLGYMPQRFGLYEDLSVQENLNLHADLQGLSAQERSLRFQSLLRLTALGPFHQRRAGALSGGMKQKLGLACALLLQPKLLLLDEPTVGVDPLSRRELWDIILGMKEAGVGILVSTAYLDEAEHADRLLLLNEGRVLSDRSPHEFAQECQGRVYAVYSPSRGRRSLQQQLSLRQGVVDAVPTSDAVRVVMRSTEAMPVGDEQWAAVAPRVEDSFMARLGQTGLQPSVLEQEPVLSLAQDTRPAVMVNQLCKNFGDFQAVRNVSFSLSRGEIFGLLGANGAGKTTTFRMLCGLLPPSSGEIRVRGQDMTQAQADIRRQMGYVSQKFALYDNLSCEQNLRFFAQAYGLRGQHARDRIQWAVQSLDLGAYAKQNAGLLPLGFKQRLSLGCALMHEPQILFLDEPTSGVDPLARREFWMRINQLAGQGVTVLVTTHFMDEAEYCDRLLLMSQGEVLAQGSPSEVRALAATGDETPSMDEAFARLIHAREAEFRRSA